MSTEEKVFVVVAAYNEASVIRAVMDDVSRHFANVVVVDDGSTDGTHDALRGVRVTLLRHAVNLGQGAALQTGISFALSRGAEYVITFDSDGQHLVSDARALLQYAKSNGVDVVQGSRFLGSTNAPRFRRVVLRLAVVFSNLTSRTKLTDTHNGLRVLSRRAAAALKITHDGMAHASQILSELSAAGFVIVEQPVTIHYTEYSMAKGQSSLNAINIAFDLLVGRLLR